MVETLCINTHISFFIFFFSSRRRHTRLVSDWSSDVCSSDLPLAKWKGELGSTPDGADVWGPFSSSGVLPSSPFHFASGGQALAGAIAVQFTLAPGEKKKIPIDRKSVV